MKIPVLVVGGAGYIGSHCAKALADAGYHPICFDNLTAGHREFVKWGPLIEGDIFDSALIRKTIQDYQIAAVLHLAGYSEVGDQSPIQSGVIQRMSAGRCRYSKQ
jgi:UDP-glucose 4-epimerase